MLTRIYTFLVVTLFILAGCASAPTRMTGLSLEHSVLASGVELNGVLISHGGKFVLDKSFQVPAVPHDKELDLLFIEDRVSFIYIPEGPWEFNGATLFPGFDSSSISCADSEVMPWRGDCDLYSQSKGPFIHIDCKSFYPPKSSLTYLQRLAEIRHEERKIEREKAETEKEKTKVDAEYTTGEIIGGTVGVGLLGAWALLRAPGVIAQAGLNKLGACANSERRVWFDHDKFFDTVKEAIINDYGAINSYVADIRQASMAFNKLANIDKGKREEIESLIQELEDSIEKQLPKYDSIDNYRIHYSPYSLVKIPRNEDWSRRPVVIETDLLSHYIEQLTSINRQFNFYIKSLKQKYGIHIIPPP